MFQDNPSSSKCIFEQYLSHPWGFGVVDLSLRIVDACRGVSDELLLLFVKPASPRSIHRISPVLKMWHSRSHLLAAGPGYG